MDKWQELESKYYMHVVNRVPVTIARGEGARVWDADGKEYLDFVGGWAANSLGHCHPVIGEALAKQAKTLILTSNQFYTIPQLQLAELLIKNSCLNRVFFGNSGAEANEGAAKLARRYGKLKLNGAYEIITANFSFHGRTLAMTAATGQPKYQQPYAPLTPGFVNVDFNSIDAIKAATTEKTCAVMLEPVQGEGGVIVPSESYLKDVRKWCDQKGILLILDEIQTGMGRLGTLHGYQQFGIEPDIMAIAKGMGGGIPIGAVLAKESCCVFQPGDHGSTFGGNPLMCATSLAVVKYIIEHDIPGNAKKVGQHFMQSLEALKKKQPALSEVRGRGLLVAIQFTSDISAKVLTACLERGLLVNAPKPNVIRFMPSLIIGNKEADEAVSIMDQAIASVVK
jgi:acetylornithine/N-succinyldiaminopimelate aminotransferase